MNLNKKKPDKARTGSLPQCGVRHAARQAFFWLRFFFFSQTESTPACQYPAESMRGLRKPLGR
jgi:hypothetical protein